MTAIFVHGVPETPAVWDALIDELGLGGQAVALQLPGFGCAAPSWAPTKEGYAEWLAAELAGHEQVDLVAHDWGALLALRVLADRPANVRSWIMDGGDLGADFQWHDLAKLWISDEGEAFMQGFVDGTAADRAALLQGAGVPAAGAEAMAGAFDATMAACILALYRSAADLGNDWGPGIDSIGGPGLVIDADQDPFKSAERPRLLAARTGARVETLVGAGHWWMLDSPQVAAPVMRSFWSTLG